MYKTFFFEYYKLEKQYCSRNLRNTRKVPCRELNGNSGRVAERMPNRRWILKEFCHVEDVLDSQSLQRMLAAHPVFASTPKEERVRQCIDKVGSLSDFSTSKTQLQFC